MSRFDVIRAWKDASYRESLSAEEQASLPEHPAGSLELHDAELDLVQAGEAELVAGGTFFGCNTRLMTCGKVCFPGDA